MRDPSGAREGGADVSRRELAALPLGLGLLAVATSPAYAAKPADRVDPSLINVLPIEDRQAIGDLFTTYVWAYDCSDEAGFLDLFTEDALIVGMGKRHAGREAMGAWFRYLLDIRERENDLWLHEAGQHRFVGTGDKCLVYSYATHFNSSPDGKRYGVRSLGYFVSECVRQRGGWKFRRFSISHWDKSMQPWKKPLPWDVA